MRFSSLLWVLAISAVGCTASTTHMLNASVEVVLPFANLVYEDLKEELGYLIVTVEADYSTSEVRYQISNSVKEIAVSGTFLAVHSGRNEFEIRLVSTSGTPLAPGRYSLLVEAYTDGGRIYGARELSFAIDPPVTEELCLLTDMARLAVQAEDGGPIHPMRMRLMLQSIGGAVAAPDVPLLRERPGTRNAVAARSSTYGRLIIYDPDFVGRLFPLPGLEEFAGWSAWFALAHELGHHTLAHVVSSHEAELAADLWASRVLRRFGASWAEIAAAISAMGPKPRSKSHPSTQERINHVIDALRIVESEEEVPSAAASLLCDARVATCRATLTWTSRRDTITECVGYTEADGQRAKTPLRHKSPRAVLDFKSELKVIPSEGCREASAVMPLIRIDALTTMSGLPASAKSFVGGTCLDCSSPRHDGGGDPVVLLHYWIRWENGDRNRLIVTQIRPMEHYFSRAWYRIGNLPVTAYHAEILGHRELESSEYRNLLCVVDRSPDPTGIECGIEPFMDFVKSQAPLEVWSTRE